MTRQSELTDQLQRVKDLPRPVLSVYVAVDAARDPTHQALELRLKNSFKSDPDLPKELVADILATFDGTPVLGRSRALFASTEGIEIIDLDLDLAEETFTGDHVAVSLGEPHLLPLLAAMDEYPPYLVVSVDRDHVLAFHVDLGQIEQVCERTRETIADEQDDIEPSKKRMSSGVSGVHPPGAKSSHTVSHRQNGATYVADRADAAAQQAAERIEHSRHSFYQEMGRELPSLMASHGQKGILVMGPDRARNAFVAALPSQLQSRVDALLPGHGVNEASILESVRPKLDELAETRKQQLLETLSEQGLKGVPECLRALQEGRLRALVAPETFTVPGYVNTAMDSSFVALTEEDAQALAPEGDVTEVDLSHALPQLAERWGTRLEFVRGEMSRRLNEDFGGMAALRRY